MHEDLQADEAKACLWHRQLDLVHVVRKASARSHLRSSPRSKLPGLHVLLETPTKPLMRP